VYKFLLYILGLIILTPINVHKCDFEKFHSAYSNTLNIIHELNIKYYIYFGLIAILIWNVDFLVGESAGGGERENSALFNR
jgi:hypothetical protein